MANGTAGRGKTTGWRAEGSMTSRRSMVVDRHFEAATVLDVEAARRNIEDALVMRRQHDGALGAHGEILELVDHQPAGDAVERRCRLGGAVEGGRADHAPGDGDTRMLGARQ